MFSRRGVDTEPISPLLPSQQQQPTQCGGAAAAAVIIAVPLSLTRANTARSRIWSGVCAADRERKRSRTVGMENGGGLTH